MVEDRARSEDAALIRRVPRAAAAAIEDARRDQGLPRGAAAELSRICVRESRCRPIGPHRIDARHAERQLRAGIRRGLVDLEGCPGLPSRPSAWGTRGPFGLVAAYHAHLLGRCAHPSGLDSLEGGARAAAAKIAGCGDGCDCVDRAALWAGRSAWAGRTVARRYANVRRHCGPTRARVWLASPWRW